MDMLTDNLRYPFIYGQKRLTRETLPFDLQFFAEEGKTEEATPRKKQEARKKGQVARSAELSTALVILTGFLVLNAFGQNYIIRLYNYFQLSFSTETLNQQLVDVAVSNLMRKSLLFIMICFLPIGLSVMVASVLTGFLQTGWNFTTEVLKPKFDKLNPFKGLKRLFSLRSLIDLAKAVLKLGIVAGIIFTSYKNQALPLAQSSVMIPSLQVVASIWRLMIDTVIRICLVLLALAVLDYFYQRYELRKSLRMTKKEVRDEHKQTEGDPMVRSRIRQKQRQMAMRRMMQQVPKADVVITNPTHLAVAVKYEAAKMRAPQLVAKGEGYVAEKIKEVAKEHSVPVVEDKPLARSIYQTVEIDEFIPPNLYQAVAEVLAFVYKLRRKAQ